MYVIDTMERVWRWGSAWGQTLSTAPVALLVTLAVPSCSTPTPSHITPSYDLAKYILKFGQIHFANWTNGFCNWDKYLALSTVPVALLVTLAVPSTATMPYNPIWDLGPTAQVPSRSWAQSQLQYPNCVAHLVLLTRLVKAVIKIM